MRRRQAIAFLLARFGWTGEPDAWRIRCRDGDGRRAVLRVGLGETGVVLRLGAANPLTVDPLGVGRLRNALREAVFAYSEVRSIEREETAGVRRRPAA